MRDFPSDTETLDELLIQAPWFTRLGQCHSDDEDILAFPSIVMIPSSFDLTAVWLPTALDEPEPFGRVERRQQAERHAGSEVVRQAVRRTYRSALLALRGIDDYDILRIGNVFYSEAARGAALYAVRSVTLDVILEEQTEWWRILNVYLEGNWPYGLLPDRRMIVI